MDSIPFIAFAEDQLPSIPDPNKRPMKPYSWKRLLAMYEVFLELPRIDGSSSFRLDLGALSDHASMTERSDDELHAVPGCRLTAIENDPEPVTLPPECPRS